MHSLSLQQTHDGFHQLKIVPLAINPVRWKAQLVAQDVVAEVQPNRERIKEVARILANHDFSLPKWDFSLGATPLYPQFQEREELLKHFLVLSSINYEYFHLGHEDQNGEALRFSEGKLSGAELATSRITEHWPQLRDAEFLSQLPYQYAEDVLFKAQVPIPRLGNRVDCLRAVGSFFRVLEKEGRLLSSVFEECNNDALEVARFVSDWIVGFKDEYLKRAQLYVAMVAGRFQGRDDNPIDPKSLAELTIIADYRVPQTMIGWGMIGISANLREHLLRKGEIREDSIWGQALRAVSITACDLLVDEVNALRQASKPSLEEVTSIHADPVLWAVPRQYQKAINNGDQVTINRLKELFIPGAEVPFPQIPTILL